LGFLSAAIAVDNLAARTRASYSVALHATIASGNNYMPSPNNFNPSSIY